MPENIRCLRKKRIVEIFLKSKFRQAHAVF